MSSRRRACAFGLALAAAGCGTTPLRDTAQEQMARGEGPLKAMEDPPAVGDPGVVAGRLEAAAIEQPGEYEARIASDRLLGATRFSIRRPGGHVSDLRLDVRPATPAQ